jgi:hypothetical protein
MENNNEFVDSQTTEDTDSVDEEVNETEEETQEVEEDDSSNELELKNKQLYERAKKAELKAKELEALLHTKKSEPKISSKETSKQDPVEFIKLAQALKDYSSEEVDIISRQARALGTDLLEAVKNEDTQLLIEAKRQKIRKEQTNPLPTNTQGGGGKDYGDWSYDDVKKLTSNPTPENIEKLNEYNQWARTRQ